MGTELVNKETGEIKKAEPTASERFTAMVINEFKGNVGELNLNDYQRQLVRNYFIGIDNSLKSAEERRSYSKKKAADPAVIWQNVNMNKLAVDVVQNAKLGLDMAVANHLSVVPYLNGKTKKYDLTLMPGYEGLRYVAIKYSIYPIVDIRVELVHKNDNFKMITKNNVDCYEFDISNPFDRGEVVGGFGYIRYKDETRNKLVTMSKAELLKRKPSTAAAEFWGGEKDKWENGKKVGTETIEGWQEEMLYKTMVRATCKKVPLDPKKINESYIYVMENAEDYYVENQEDKVKQEIEDNANKELIDVTPQEIPSETLNESQEISQPVSEEENIDTTERPSF